MAAEVNMRECAPQKDNEKRHASRSNRIPRRTKQSPAKNRGTERAAMSGVPETEPVMRTSVLQGKVKDLKEKHRVSQASESYRGEGETQDGGFSEDALVTPELRTYLTEEALNCSKQRKFCDAEPETCGLDEFWGSPTRREAAMSHYNGRVTVDLSGYPALPMYNQNEEESDTWVWPPDQLQASSQELSCAPQSLSHLSWEPSSLSLAERVERNRQELRGKLNNTCDSGGTPHGDTHNIGDNGQVPTSKDTSWLFLGDMDGDSGVSLPDSEGCRELSVRHEQAKQLLYRARMKAKGASPLRASHCVLPHPHSQSPLRRGPCVSGALTDGGSLSDSSSSDYCSWHRGSRGSSPSHVRFQDESERDAEERYRERQQRGPQPPCVNTTPPPTRHSNGHLSWTQHLTLSGNGQCGTCSFYITGSGANQNPGAASQCTNSQNIHRGSRTTQEGPLTSPLGIKPSPHWILPSQPWRVHTELIRETHIGGDSTADSSGEEDASRGQSKTCRAWVTRRSSRNNLRNAVPEPGATTYPSNPDPETGNRASLSSLIQLESRTNSSQQNPIPDLRAKSNPAPLKPDRGTKTSASNLEPETVIRTNQLNAALKPGTRTIPQVVETRTRKNPALETGKEPKTLNPEFEIRNSSLNLETRARTNTLSPADGKTLRIYSLDVSPAQGGLTLSGRVPVPPAGRARTTVPSRTSRFTMRPEGTSQGRDVVQIVPDQKGNKSDEVPKSQKKNEESLRDSDNQQSVSGSRTKEHGGRERLHNAKEQLDNQKPNEARVQRSRDGLHVAREQLDRERARTTRRQRDRERPHTIRGHQEAEPTYTAKDPPDRKIHIMSRDQLVNERPNAAREQKGSEGSNPRGQQQQHTENGHTGGDICSSEINFLCQPTQDKHLVQEPMGESGPIPCVPPLNPLHPAARKGDICSGMRKIFSTFGLTTRPRLGQFQSSSMEQISTPATEDTEASGAGGKDPCDGAVKPGRIKKSPSLQSLKLMSPFHLPRKASSVQNLLRKSDRSSVYVTGETKTAPRRALSVEDIGSPGMARVVGRVAEVYPDGTRLLELQRPPQGNFGFSISSGNGRPDSGVYVQEMRDASAAKLYSGLLRVGDEILEVNDAKVSTLGPAQLSEIMDREPMLSLRVLHQRRSQC
ncbi:uncharacterized protein KIAA1614 homolog [Ascaphus truei]|uniref:uncharacterized protein KIAA1614 homolog n=1 Tax=Ascaphus truei TaxID=8439 RepID=UPI003F59B02F